MGRPLKKLTLHKLGVYSHHPAYGTVYRQIFKQESSTRFTFSDDADGYYTVGLVDKDANDLAAGEGCIYAVDHAGNQLTVKKLADKKVTLSDGNTYRWFTSDVSSIPTPEEGQAWLYSYYYLDW